MELKKFYADNMQEALKTIKSELGPDAVIISSKMVRQKKGLSGLFAKKKIEVVVSYDDVTFPFKPTYANNRIAAAYGKPQAAVTPPPPMAPPIISKQEPQAESQFIPLQKEMFPKDSIFTTMQSPEPRPQEKNEKQDSYVKINGLDERITELKDLLNQLSDKMGPYDHDRGPQYSREVKDLYKTLIDNDIESNLAQEICNKTEEISHKMEARPRDVAKSILMDLLGTPHFIQNTKYKQKVIMLVGPTGVGKTTTLIKLASSMVVKNKLNVGIINTDVYRVAAQEHLKAYCEILNTNFITIYKPEEIRDALDAMGKMDMVFIDTAGKLAKDNEYQRELKSLVEMGDIDEIYLTVSASTSEKVLRTIIEDYDFLRNYNIIVTKIDEVQNQGVLLYISKISRRPISYLTTGQNVPDDIVRLKPEEIVNTILGS